LAQGVACERTYQVLVEGEPKPLLCRWFVPEPHPEGDWECRGTLTMADGGLRTFKAGGVDSAQALVLAMQRVAADLLAGDLPAYWFDQDDDLGLPHMDAVAEDVAARKARFKAGLKAR
jgi:hypothetical protein